MAESARDKNQGHYERAPRIQIGIPLRFRASGEDDWREGRTENISRSGVLFETERPVEPGTRVEMTFVLPSEIGKEDLEAVTGAIVFCEGQIVRTVLPATSDAYPVVAAKTYQDRFGNLLRRKGARFPGVDPGPF